MEEINILSLFKGLTKDEQAKQLLQLISESLNDPNFDFEQIIDAFLSEDE